MTAELDQILTDRSALEDYLDDGTESLAILPTPGEEFDEDSWDFTWEEFVEAFRAAILRCGTDNMVFVRTLIGRVLRFASTRNPTLWVDLGQVGWPAMYCNPEFFMSFDDAKGQQFSLVHEAGPLQMRHLQAKRPLIDRYNDALAVYRTDPSEEAAADVGAAERALKLHTDACEYVVNDRAMIRLGISKLPTARGGKTKFMDPKVDFRKYRKVAEEHSIAGFPDDYDDFVASVTACTGYLELLPEDAKPTKGRGGCRFSMPDTCPDCGRKFGTPPDAGDGQPDDGDASDGGDGQSDDSDANDGGQGSGSPCQTCSDMTDDGAHGDGRITNDDALDDTMDKIYGDLIDRALAGDENAKRDIITVMDMDPDNPMWGTLGAAQLVGKPVTTKVDETWWENRARAIFRSEIRPAPRPTWNRSRAGIADPRAKRMLGIPHDPRFGEPLGRRGRTYIPKVAVIGDVSGSVPQTFWDSMLPIIGEVEDKMKILWGSHDAKVILGQPGVQVKSGGGTSFQCVERVVAGDYRDQWVEGDVPDDWRRARRQKFDLVVVVTDGYAPEIQPADPGRWVWFIIPMGTADNPTWNDWPAQKGMRVLRLPPNYMSGRPITG